MSAREELTEIVDDRWHGYGYNPQGAADAILAAGYSKQRIIGYIVVDRGGVTVGNQYKYVESAQTFADEWTADCQTAGIDWDYRVATITEPQP